MNTAKILKYVEIGKRDADWYPECTKVFIELFGADQLDTVSKIFAATSINTSLKSNITLFRKAYGEILEGRPVGNYLPNIKIQLERIRAGQDLSGRKINAFYKCLSGDLNHVVVDIWLTRAFGLHRSRTINGQTKSYSPTTKEYDIIEAWVKEAALFYGTQPANLASMIWAGVRIYETGKFETRYTQTLKYTLTNLFNVL